MPSSSRTALLRPYSRKRDFQKTPEPQGKVAHSTHPLSFVVQKHDATRLHYDFRLEADGVLKSWAVPKGPSFDPTVKRLAIQTEDHPLEYAGFEGVIPQGEYGGGNVIVWDRGSYRNMTTHNGRELTLSQGIERGHIAVSLNGTKLKGGFALTRIQSGSKPQWLMVKIHDEKAGGADPVATQPESVMSSRTVESLGPTQRSRRSESSAEKWMAPMLATLVKEPFNRKGWLFEPKLDGERCLAYRDGKQIRLFTRNQQPLNVTYPELVDALGKQSPDRFVLDGEIVAYADGQDVPSFRELQRRMHIKSAAEVRRSPVRVFYIVFDVLSLNGIDVRQKPLVERRALLEKSFRFGKILQLNPATRSAGIKTYRLACRRGAEGIIAKRMDGPYRGGRSSDWLKMKCLNEQEFIIGGYSDPQGSRSLFGALLLGYYEEGRLRFAGKVGTGFDQQTLRLVSAKLKPLARANPPFASIDIPRAGLHWVDPKLVAQIGFAEWTADGKLRQPRFLGLRDDKAAAEVIREKPQSSEQRVIAAPAKPSRKIPQTNSNILTIDKKEISVTHLNKIFYPSTGFTKGEMIDYYVKMAPVLLPHLRGRPLTMKRYPDGVRGFFFYEKQAPSYRPSWMRTQMMRDEKTGKETRYLVIDDLPSLVWLVNLGSLELHTVLARAPQVEQPTYVAFDLDPGPPAGYPDCARIALELRDVLEELGLQSFPKTSGSKGLHIFVPLNTRVTYAETQAFAHGLANLIVQRQPQEVVSNMRKELRKGKVFIDWSQNSRHKTTVCAYSLRAQDIPSVSAPLEWSEVELQSHSKSTTAPRMSADEMIARVGDRGDLFAAVETLKQKLPSFRRNSGASIIVKG